MYFYLCKKWHHKRWGKSCRVSLGEKHSRNKELIWAQVQKRDYSSLMKVTQPRSSAALQLTDQLWQTDALHTSTAETLLYDCHIGCFSSLTNVLFLFFSPVSVCSSTERPHLLLCGPSVPLVLFRRQNIWLFLSSPSLSLCLLLSLSIYLSLVCFLSSRLSVQFHHLQKIILYCIIA